jgi:hypothetical protein
MRAISKEKRELIVGAKERGETTREIALWYKNYERGAWLRWVLS